MSAILLAAFLFRATFVAPPKPTLHDMYAYAGFTDSQCWVTDWGWWDWQNPTEAQCDDGHGRWAQFLLGPEVQ